MITEFNKFNNGLTLSDIVHGNFKVKLKKYNNYYTEFYIDDILVARIHDNKQELFVDKIIDEIIKPKINLTEDQYNHKDTISVKKINKNSIKKSIRNYLEDLLYIGITPIELVAYTYLDFKK